MLLLLVHLETKLVPSPFTPLSHSCKQTSSCFTMSTPINVLQSSPSSIKLFAQLHFLHSQSLSLYIYINVGLGTAQGRKKKESRQWRSSLFSVHILCCRRCFSSYCSMYHLLLKLTMLLMIDALYLSTASGNFSFPLQFITPAAFPP